jgi:hypothetical protein
MGRRRVTAPDRPTPGRRPLDGSRALARLMRAGKVDRRTAPAKACARVNATIADDWGGLDRMPGTARLLCDRAAFLTVRVLLREARLMREAAAGIDDPSSDKHTLGMLNTLRRCLATLEEMRAREGASKVQVPSLEDYLRFRDDAAQNAVQDGQTAPEGDVQDGPLCHGHTVNVENRPLCACGSIELAKVSGYCEACRTRHRATVCVRCDDVRLQDVEQHEPSEELLSDLRMIANHRKGGILRDLTGDGDDETEH